MAALPSPASSPSPTSRASPAASCAWPAWMPHGAELNLEEVVIGEDGIELVATTSAPSAACPQCGVASLAVHSRYGRTIIDLPWSTARVVLSVRPRRFRCRQGACPQRIFCERLPQLV